MVAIARGYDALGRAARTGDAGTYRRARAAVTAKERGLDGLLKRLGIVVDAGDA